MIILMKEALKQEIKTELPGAWYRNKDASVWHEMELYKPGTGDAIVFDLEDDGIIDELKQLQQVGVRGEVHFADSCSLRYIRMSLMDAGVFQQTGEVIWTSKLEEVSS